MRVHEEGFCCACLHGIISLCFFELDVIVADLERNLHIFKEAPLFLRCGASEPRDFLAKLLTVLPSKDDKVLFRFLNCAT